MLSLSPLPERDRPLPSSARRLLAADLRERAFAIGRPAKSPRKIGAEIELIPVDAVTGRIVPIVAPRGGASSLPVLRAAAAHAEWIDQTTPGLPFCFRTGDGTFVSYEPGGQIEISSAAFPSARELIRSVEQTIGVLQGEAERLGVRLSSVGIHPSSTIDQVPLQLRNERYCMMDEYLARIGPAGARMMRQTASCQISLDWEDDALARWRVLNAAAPLLIAIFANSPVYDGVETGARSYRSRVWRELDPARTGVVGWDDPVEEYLDMALDAPDVLRRTALGETPPFRDWLGRGETTMANWHAHLTTLFPEVRPKEFVEVRSIDAIGVEWFAVPVVLLAGIVYDPASLREAEVLLPRPDREMLARAGEVGLADPILARRARQLFELGLRGARSLEGPFLDGAAIETAHAFFDRYTRVGRSPADDFSSLDALT